VHGGVGHGWAVTPVDRAEEDPRKGRSLTFPDPAAAYASAGPIVIAQGDEDTDRARAVVLGVNERTIRNWRSRGLIGGGRPSRP
jgi:hypothetical protein